MQITGLAAAFGIFVYGIGNLSVVLKDGVFVQFGSLHELLQLLVVGLGRGDPFAQQGQHVADMAVEPLQGDGEVLF